MFKKKKIYFKPDHLKYSWNRGLTSSIPSFTDNRPHLKLIPNLLSISHDFLFFSFELVQLLG